LAPGTDRDEPRQHPGPGPKGATTSVLRRGLDSIGATLLAGLLVLLPIALTVAVLGWVVSLLLRFAGPGSLVGRLFAAIGYPFSSNPELAYLLGTLILLAGIFVLGLLARAGLERHFRNLADRTVRRIPVVGSLYGLAERFAGVLDQKPGADIGGMKPVWCFFGENSAAVLALAPRSEPIDIGGREYIAVLVPTAPVPFGGALIYVPVQWVRPAEIGVERLTAIYVSMGMTSPTDAPRR
jgi:uncharacterized membrane protein